MNIMGIMVFINQQSFMSVPASHWSWGP